MLKEELAEFVTVCLCLLLHCCAACVLDSTLIPGVFYPFSFESHAENCVIMWISVFISRSLAGITWLETWAVDAKNSGLKGKENIFEIVLMNDDTIIYVEQVKKKQSCKFCEVLPFL